MKYNPLLINKAKYGGQNYSKGLTLLVTSGVIGDVVSAGTTSGAQGTALICPDGAEPIGILGSKDNDNYGAVYSFETVAVVRYTGTVLYGVVGITGDGAGGVKFVASGTANSLKVLNIGVQTVNSVNLAALIRQ